MQTGSPSTARPDLSPYSILRALWKAKWTIAFTFAGLSVLAVLGIRLIPTSYSAGAVILVDSQTIPEKYVATTVSADLQDRLANLSRQITSSPFLQKIIDKLGLYREERKAMTSEAVIALMRDNIGITLEKGVTSPVDQKEKSGVGAAAKAPGMIDRRNRPDAFRITFRAQNPALAADVANQLANVFVEENTRTRETSVEGTSDFILQQLALAQKSLDEQEAKISHFKQQHNGELPQQENSLIAALGRLQLELQTNQDAINRAQQNKVMYENSLSLTEASAGVLAKELQHSGAGLPSKAGEAGRTDPARAPVKQTDKLRAQLAAARLDYTEDHPEVKRLERELARAEEQEKHAPPTETAQEASAPAAPQTAANPELVKQREHIDTLKSQVAAMKKEIEDRTAKQDETLKNIAAYQARIERLPIREQELTSLTRDYEIYKANYKSLLDKKLSAEMATAMEKGQQGERFTVLETALPPDQPTFPNRPLFDLLACAAALGIATGIGFLSEFRKNLLLGEWELPSDVTILGRVPFIKASAAELERYA